MRALVSVLLVATGTLAGMIVGAYFGVTAGAYLPIGYETGAWGFVPGGIVAGAFTAAYLWRRDASTSLFTAALRLGGWLVAVTAGIFVGVVVAAEIGMRLGDYVPMGHDEGGAWLGVPGGVVGAGLTIAFFWRRARHVRRPVNAD